MAGYKGYYLEQRSNSSRVLVSPLGVDIALFSFAIGSKLPSMKVIEDGLQSGGNYTTLTEIVKDLVDKHRRLHGEDDLDDPVVGCGDARNLVKNTVTNYIQVNHNSLGVQMSGEQLQLQINEAIDNASPVTLKKVLKEWIPQAVLGAGLGTLLTMLGLGG